MSLFDDASLVLIPDGAKDGKLYSVKPTDGSGDFTFTRGSNLAATRVDENGLIEKGRENLILQSNQFDTTWTNFNSTETSGEAGYDGTNDAWLLTASGINSRIQNSQSGTGVYTLSCYMKKGTTDWARLSFFATNNPRAYFDLNNGVIGTTAFNIDASIEDVGGGWYRCSISANLSSTTSAAIYVADGDDSLQTSNETIYIQDAQLEVGLVATDYIETGATTAQAGILEDLPRIDYSGGASCPALLLEPQRTNVVEYAEYFDIYTKSNATITNNDSLSPEGLINAASIAGDGATTSHFIYRNSGTAVSSTDYTISFFAKSGSLDYVQIVMGSGAFGVLHQNFDLANGTIGSSSGSVTPFIEAYTNNWYRVGITITATASTTITPFIVLANSSTMSRLASFTTSSDVKIYGLQIEEGSYPTSYIPTYGSSVTRSGEVCTKTSATALIGQTEGTLFTEVEFTGNTGGRFLSINDGTAANRILIARNSNNSVSLIVSTSSATQAAITTGILADGLHKFGVSYETDEFVFYVDGALIGTDTSGVVPACSVIDIGNENGLNIFGDSISQAIIFPTRISNTELAALTTL